MIKYSVVGSHGYKASYGGWDQLVNNLVEKKTKDVCVLVFNPKETPQYEPVNVENVRVVSLPLSAQGAEGVIYDSISILISVLKGYQILLLGIAAMPVMAMVKILLLGKIQVVANIGGVEWERPQFNRLTRAYLKFCLWLTKFTANVIIIDNEYYLKFFKEKATVSGATQIIPYGGVIDRSISTATSQMKGRFPFLGGSYFLSISRAISDNKLLELCETFAGDDSKTLVLCSNFSSTSYGKTVFSKFKNIKNIYLIDKLYDKPILDYIRVNCKAYIHTHTLCGSAPSLIEMIVSERPIISVDIPQNRYTLANSGGYFQSFNDLPDILSMNSMSSFIPNNALQERYSWSAVVRQYENCFRKG